MVQSVLASWVYTRAGPAATALLRTSTGSCMWYPSCCTVLEEPAYMCHGRQEWQAGRTGVVTGVSTPGRVLVTCDACCTQVAPAIDLEVMGVVVDAGSPLLEGPQPCADCVFCSPEPPLEIDEEKLRLLEQVCRSL